jgi:hypothetical protein
MHFIYEESGYEPTRDPWCVSAASATAGVLVEA